MSVAWHAWWLLAWLTPLVPWPGLSASHGGRVSLLGCSALALALGACDARTPRALSFRWAVLTILTLSAWELWRWSAVSETVPWLYRWGAWWDTAGWTLVWLAGTCAVARHSPSLPRWWPGLISAFLGCNLVRYAVRWGQINWVGQPVDLGGWLPGHVSWAAWCALSLPILWRWNRWASLPAWAGLVVASSMGAWVALLVAWVGPGVWRTQGWRRSVVALGGAAALGCWLRGAEVVTTCVQQRLSVWEAVLRAIARFPRGIGWEFGSYQAVAQVARAPILPHPASDGLMLPLRYGWWTVVPLVAASVWVWRQPATPLAQSLRIAWALAAWQTSVSLPSVGGLVWLLWLLHQLTEGGAHAQRAQA